MTIYRLKSGPAFQVAEGDMKGVTFEPGVNYTRIPEHMADRFESIEPASATKKKKNEVNHEITESEA